LFGQEHQDVLQGAYTQCYYSKEAKSPILIYDAMNGTIVDTLHHIDDNTWYKLTILESEYGWFKIKELRTWPTAETSNSYENYWIKNHNFLVSVDHSKDTKYVYLYDLPSKKANKIHKLDEFQKVSVTEVDGQWSKVRFKVGQKEIEGWMGLKYQIANPLITAIKSD
jgi:hypothetical protein